FTKRLQASSQPWAIIAPARGQILVKVRKAHTSGDERIALQIGVLGIFRPKTTKCSGGPAVCGLQRGITFFEIPIWALFE
ncbi:hypothetical protein, partial [Pseudomonas aeruginosa]|uniref:hypothetical protein n=1 Tax=Pseudomonas aeruginosa TaxID=287 RepID=UPI001CA52E96